VNKDPTSNDTKSSSSYNQRLPNIKNHPNYARENSCCSQTVTEDWQSCWITRIFTCVG